MYYINNYFKDRDKIINFHIIELYDEISGNMFSLDLNNFNLYIISLCMNTKAGLTVFHILRIIQEGVHE